MLEVFKKGKLAIEFDNVSNRLKDDLVFVKKTKDIFRSNSNDYFSLCILLRKWRKQKKVELECQEDKETLANKEEKSTIDKVQKVIKSKPNKTVNTFNSSPKVVQKPIVTAKNSRKNQSSKINLASISNQVIGEFEDLIKKLPINDSDYSYLIAKYKNASEHEKLVALMMVCDYLNYYQQDTPVKLMRNPNNKDYMHLLRF